MAEKIKYIVKCTFCDKDYTVEIENGEDFSCPTCGGAGSREHASRVKSALESAEIEELEAELKKHKMKALFGKKRSIESIAKDEELLDEFQFDRIDRYESHIYKCESSMECSDVVKDEVDEDREMSPVTKETSDAWVHVGMLFLFIIWAVLSYLHC